MGHRVMEWANPNNYYNEYLMPPKMSKYAQKICNIMCTLLHYAENAAKCQICGNRIFAFFGHAYYNEHINVVGVLFFIYSWAGPKVACIDPKVKMLR